MRKKDLILIKLKIIYVKNMSLNNKLYLNLNIKKNLLYK